MIYNYLIYNNLVDSFNLRLIVNGRQTFSIEVFICVVNNTIIITI